LVRTVGNRKEFKEYFYETAREWFREQVGFGDVFSGDEDVNFGYLDEIIAKDYKDLSHYSSLVGIFAFIAILLAMLGLLAMSTYYAGTNTKGIAIRKVFGGTVNSETWRSVLNYMVWVALAIVIAVPVGVMLVRRFLETYPERISRYWWIFVLSVLLVLAISFASVLWQTLSAARTDPAVELKKE
jgi:putative ABC transport system permease protein